MTAYPLSRSIERVSRFLFGKAEMADRKSTEPSAETRARANRRHLAQEEGVRAMADIEQKGIALRKNMERLRALREAREAQAASAPSTLPGAATKKRKKAIRS